MIAREKHGVEVKGALRDVRVRPMNELFPLERAAKACDRMMSGKARFRVVLTTGS
jgi:D-arabinose 1-dehydrogenase-like Zn-dependent alcohol dehydrogenase